GGGKRRGRRRGADLERARLVGAPRRSGALARELPVPDRDLALADLPLPRLDPRRRAARFGGRRGGFGRKLAVPLLRALLLAVAVVAQFRRGGELLRAQHLLWSVERRTMVMMRSGSFDKVKLRGNIEALNEAKRLDPAEIGVPTLIGSQHLLLAEPEAA